MRLALIIAITISLFAPPQREATSVVGASTFSSSFGKFSITLPSPTAFGPLTIPTPFGNARGQLFQWETKEGTFGVGYADAFQSLQDPEVARDFFDSATGRFKKVATANSGAIATVKQITLDRYPGIEQRVELFTGMVIQRTYIASRRVYEVVAVLKNNQKIYESVALGVLDSFKVLTEADVQAIQALEVAKAEPSPLPQTPAVQRAGTDVSDEGLQGRVKSVLTEREDLSGTGSALGRKRESFNTYNEQGYKLRTESHDQKGFIDQITVYGFIQGSRVAASKWIPREGSPPPRVGVAVSPLGAPKTLDLRFQTRFEFKYDEKKRLIEKTLFHNNGDVRIRYVFRYNGSQKEELSYSANGSLSGRAVSTLDLKGNKVEQTLFHADGSLRLKEVFTYEFDSKGNWTKRTASRIVMKDGREQPEPFSIHFRTITYY